jgi:CheY-like chemotaxis protein
MSRHEGTMLIVEDDPAWRAMYLMEFGQRFQCYEAVDGLQALSMVDWVQPDIILLDLRLPRMGGAEFLQALDRKGIRTPVVVSTGWAEGGEAARMPGVHVAMKTADLRHVRTAVREAVRAPWGADRRPARPATVPESEWMN